MPQMDPNGPFARKMTSEGVNALVSESLELLKEEEEHKAKVRSRMEID